MDCDVTCGNAQVYKAWDMAFVDVMQQSCKVQMHSAVMHLEQPHIEEILQA